jgi:HEAT repeat protein
LQYERLLRASRDAEERRAAAEALAGIQGDSQVLIFAEALGADPDDVVRLRCAEVLARRIDHASAQRALMRAVEDPNPQVARAAIEGLRTRRDAEVARVLFRRLGAGSSVVNGAVEETLAELYRDDPLGFVDRAMGTDRPAAIIAMIRVLERLEHASTLPLLRELLKSLDPEVRAASVRAAASTGLPEVGTLIGKMLDDPHEAVRIGTLEVLAREGPNALVRLASARSDPSAAVRCKLAELLERMPAAASGKVIDGLLDDASPRVRASALATLLALGDGESLRRFSNAFAKAQPDTVSQLQHDPRAAAITRKLAQRLRAGGDSAQRELAVVAIAALASEGYEQLLLPVLRDPRSSVRLAAARTLASSRAPEIQKRVGELTEDPEFAVREGVKEALSRLGL